MPTLTAATIAPQMIWSVYFVGDVGGSVRMKKAKKRALI